MTARYLVADAFDGLATLEDQSVDLVVTSPPFLALRSYLPADHPDKGKEIGSEATPAEFLDVLLTVTAELRRVLAPHGSICVELGDTYSGSGGAGGDYLENGWRDGQPKFDGSNIRKAWIVDHDSGRRTPGEGWPLAKSRTLIPELYRLALAYGINPLTGTESPAGQWRIRNVVTWCRPNPPVGALGDKWRPATSDVVVACVSAKRYWDDIATRKPYKEGTLERGVSTRPMGNKTNAEERGGGWSTLGPVDLRDGNGAGAPLLDYWEIPPTGYNGAHYAVYPPALVEPLIKAMAPPKVCQECGQPSRRVIERTSFANGLPTSGDFVGRRDRLGGIKDGEQISASFSSVTEHKGWSDCGHDSWRPAHILDPFAGTGTTGLVATGHGHDATLIDIDERNRDLALERIGPFLFEEVTA